MKSMCQKKCIIIMKKYHKKYASKNAKRYLKKNVGKYKKGYVRKKCRFFFGKNVRRLVLVSM